MPISSNLYLDLYVLQTVPPANLNRGVDGSPKTAQFGGVTRTRVSSQSWKHAMRNYFADHDHPTTNRTTRIPQLLATELQAQNAWLGDEEALELAETGLKAAGIKGITKQHTTKTLLSVTPAQLQAVARYLSTCYLTNHTDPVKKDLQPLLLGDRTLDLELFGRMVADNQELTIDGAAQVAHALSVNAVEPEYDYFTAMDDQQPADQAGAFKIGEAEFNAPTLYRYANLNVRQLINDLGADDALTGLAGFVKAFVLSMPTGKQHTYANKTLPSYIMATLRTDTPVNLVQAYEAPVTANEQGFVPTAIDRLNAMAAEAGKLTETPLTTVTLDLTGTYNDDDAINLPDLIDQLTDDIKDVIANADPNH